MSKHYIRKDLIKCPEFAKRQIRVFGNLLEFWKKELKKINDELAREKEEE